MISITREEAFLIKRQFPNSIITVTNKGKNSAQKNRYVEEFSYIIKALEMIRSSENGAENEFT